MNLSAKVKNSKGAWKWLLGGALGFLGFILSIVLTYNINKAAKDKAAAQAKQQDFKDMQELGKLIEKQDDAKQLAAQADQLKAQIDAEHQAASDRLAELAKHKAAIEKATNWKELDEA